LHSIPASQGRMQDIELAMVSQRVYDHGFGISRALMRVFLARLAMKV